MGEVITGKGVSTQLCVSAGGGKSKPKIHSVHVGQPTGPDVADFFDQISDGFFSDNNMIFNYLQAVGGAQFAEDAEEEGDDEGEGSWL